MRENFWSVIFSEMSHNIYTRDDKFTKILLFLVSELIYSLRRRLQSLNLN